jgi:xanthine dehydrogenase accessory factor
MNLNELKFIIKGAGDMGSGVAWRLYRAGFKRLVMLDVPCPMAVRRSVSFCEAIYDGAKIVDGITAVAAENIEEIEQTLKMTEIPVVIDPTWQTIAEWQPQVVIDAILAKKNLGTHIDEAELVIGLGPGFCAPEDVHVVIETNRGAHCGCTIYQGCAEKNTGIPGTMMGYDVKRVMRAPVTGTFNSTVLLDEFVEVGDILGTVENSPVLAKINGTIRGLIRDQVFVKKGVKIGDIEPRAGVNIHRVSDKSLSIGGAVLEAVLTRYNV